VVNTYNTIQYKNDFYSAVIEGAEALMGRLWMVQCSTADKQMSLLMFFEYCQTSSVDYIIRESVPHGRRRDGKSATADDRSCPRDDQPLRTARALWVLMPEMNWMLILTMIARCTVIRIRLITAVLTLFLVFGTSPARHAEVWSHWAQSSSLVFRL